MLDRWALPLLKPALHGVAKTIQSIGISADSVTVAGFVVGLLSVPALVLGEYWLALVAIVINRVCDGVDGEIARLTQTSDAGGYLDIVLDFVFYSAVVCGFAWADPQENALPAATLLFAFVGTGTSFLAFAVLAEKHGLVRSDYPAKGFYYLQGLTEGTETIILFALVCIFPGAFAPLAYGFAALCAVTTLTRVVGGYRTLQRVTQADHAERRR